MNKRLSQERQALVLAALCEGTPINATARMFRVGKHALLRVILEIGEAFADYMFINFGYEGYSYGTETKIFGEPMLSDGTLAQLGRNEGVRRLKTADRKAVVGSPDLESLTTSHIERAFLTVRQELKRFQRKGLGYSKDLETHKLAVALHFGVYNFVRKHHSLGVTPAVAAGLELDRWSLERVVEMTADYLRRREDAKFEEVLA